MAVELMLDTAYEEDQRPPAVRDYGMRQLCVNDPDGYNLCFQRPATRETCDQWRTWYGLAPEQGKDIGPDA